MQRGFLWRSFWGSTVLWLLFCSAAQLLAQLLTLTVALTFLPVAAEARGPQQDVALAQAREQASTLLQAGKNTEAYTLYMSLLRENPDDPLVNMGLAKAAVALGEYNQAILALERLVDTYPKDAGLRVELARVLCKVDDAPAAQRELELAKSLDPTLTDEIADKVLQRLKQEYRRWQFSGRVSGGLVYDSNVNMGPNSASLQLGPWLLQMDSSSTRKESWGLFGMSSLDGGWRTGPDSPWWVVGDVTLYRKSYLSDVPTNREMSWARGAVGLRHISATTLFDLRMKADTAEYIGDDQAAFSTGPELLWLWALAPNVQFLTRAALENRQYRQENGRQGTYLWIGEYLRLIFGARGHDITMGGRWLHSATETEAYGAHGWEGSVQSTVKLPHGVELYPSLTYRREYYHGPATALEVLERKDDNLRVGLGLSWFVTPELSVDLSWQYSNNNSTSPLYDYNQHLLSTGLTIRF